MDWTHQTKTRNYGWLSLLLFSFFLLLPLVFSKKAFFLTPTHSVIGRCNHSSQLSPLLSPSWLGGFATVVNVSALKQVPQSRVRPLRFLRFRQQITQWVICDWVTVEGFSNSVTSGAPHVLLSFRIFCLVFFNTVGTALPFCVRVDDSLELTGSARGHVTRVQAIRGLAHTTHSFTDGLTPSFVTQRCACGTGIILLNVHRGEQTPSTGLRHPSFNQSRI